MDKLLPKKKATFFYSDKDDWSAERTNAYVDECIAAKDEFKLAEAYNFQGHLFMSNRQDDCREAFRKSIEFATRSSHTHALAMSQFYLGMYTDELAERLRLVYASLENMRNTEDRYMEAGILYQLGVWYHQMGDVSRALELWNESIPVFESSDNPGGVAWALIGMARSANQVGGKEEALPFYETAVEKSREYELIASEIVALQGLAQLNLDLKNTEAAEAYLRRLIEIQPEPGVYDAEVIEQIKARVLIAKGEVVRAEEIMLEALQHARERDDQVILKEIADLLCGMYVSQGRDKDAAVLYEESFSFLGARTNRIEELRVKVELAKLYKRLGSSEKTLELFDAILENYEIVYKDDYREKVITLQKLLAAEKERSESMALRIKAEQLEREIGNTTLQLVAQTELLTELRNDLLKFIRKFPMPDGAARELRERLKTLPCKAVDWERFDTQFKAAHPEFTKKLLEAHPKLTPTEARMCSLLRMNLRSAEIARLFCLSGRTVEDHRANIRKKMKLKHSEDLMAYLVKL